MKLVLQEILVDWFKSEIGNENICHLVDKKLPEVPPSKEFKQMILVSLRCVDPDVNPKLKMGDVIRMLEPRHLLLSDVRTQLVLIPIAISLPISGLFYISIFISSFLEGT